jgi:filamentous hemagglutinin
LQAGTKGGWNKQLNGKLTPNAKYEVNDYLYQTDDLGRITGVQGDLVLNTRARNTYQQGKAGREGLQGDEGGHFIASIFDGPGEKINLFAQNRNFNRGEWKKLENSWADALKNNQSVNVNINPVYNAESIRPDILKIRYQIDGGKPVYVRFHNQPGG